MAHMPRALVRDMLGCWMVMSDGLPPRWNSIRSDRARQENIEFAPVPLTSHIGIIAIYNLGFSGELLGILSGDQGPKDSRGRRQ
jgi:hypothetical protein